MMKKLLIFGLFSFALFGVQSAQAYQHKLSIHPEVQAKLDGKIEFQVIEFMLYTALYDQITVDIDTK